DCVAEKFTGGLRHREHAPGAPGRGEKLCVLSGMAARLPVPPCPSVKVSFSEPWPLSAPPVALPFRYQITDPTPCPPMRNDTSVPGITKERGKLPASTGPPGPGAGGGGGTCASWSIRRCKSS